MAELAFFVIAPGLFLALIVAYVQRHKRSGLSLWRAVALFSGIFFGLAALGIALMIGVFQLLEINPKYTWVVSLLLLLGVLAPAWQLGIGKISTNGETHAL